MSESQHPIKPRWTLAIATEMIGKWKRSRLSRAAFCRREEIALYTLSYWIRKTGRSSRSSLKNPGFVEVKNIVRPTATHCPPIELVTPSGFQLTLPAGFSAGDFQRTLSVLKSSSC